MRWIIHDYIQYLECWTLACTSNISLCVKKLHLFPSALVRLQIMSFKQPRFPTTLEVVLHILWVRGPAPGVGDWVGPGIILILVCLCAWCRGWWPWRWNIMHCLKLLNNDYTEASLSIFFPQIYRNCHPCRIYSTLFTQIMFFLATRPTPASNGSFKYPSALRLWFSSVCCSHRASRFVTPMPGRGVVHWGPGVF